MGNNNTMNHSSSLETNSINCSIRCCCNEKPIEIYYDSLHGNRPVQNEKNIKEQHDSSNIINHENSYNKEHSIPGNTFIISHRKIKSDTIINFNITKNNTFFIRNFSNSFRKAKLPQYNNNDDHSPTPSISIDSPQDHNENDHLQEIKPPGIILSDDSPFTSSLSPQVEMIEKEIGKFTYDPMIPSNTTSNTTTNNNNTPKKLKRFNMRYEDNTLYSGEFNSLWEKEGYGVLYSSDGNKYEGFFTKDKFNGKGRLINGDGSYFEGDFINGKANGFGRYLDPTGRKYIGDFVDEMLDGKAEEITPRGTRYEGEYKRNIKKGKGILELTDGSRYEGDFDNNIIHGFGLFKWNDGRSYKGQWKNGKMQGYGIFTWVDDLSYIGHYKLDIKVGFGIFIWGNSRIYEGYWKNGKQHGYGKIIKASNDGEFNKECEIIYAKYEQGKRIKVILKDSDIAQIQKRLNVKKIKMLQLLTDLGVKINYY